MSLKDALNESLRSGLLFGVHEEPLDAYGRRIVRVIVDAIEREACKHGIRWPHECSDCEQELAGRLANARTEELSSPEREPDGYAVLLEDKVSSKWGFWFVGIWNTKESADLILSKSGAHEKVSLAPMYFVRSPLARRPEEKS